MSFLLHLPCAAGTELAVVKELEALGARDAKKQSGVVTCVGDWDVLAGANVFSRCASRVLLEVASFDAVRSEADLLEALSSVPFEERLTEKATFAVDAHLSDCAWTHTRYAAQRTKDAIVDRLRANGHGRPNVDVQRPSLRYVLHWERERVTLSLDSSGEPLHRRGYRAGVEGRAPMKETLAAALLAIGHADVERPFLDPCCGTGTLAIEQAWRALRRAPGRDRRFGFERWSWRPPELDRALAKARQRARDEERAALPAPIRLSDWHREAIDAAEACIEQAGLAAHIAVERVDARRVSSPGDRPIICANLPFGERLGENRLQLDGFYRTLGAHLQSFSGARLLLFSGHPRARELLGLDAVARKQNRWRFKSGPLDATLYRWDM